MGGYDKLQKLNVQLPIIFYSSIKFVIETAFISKQIAENRFGALLEIIKKFIIVFSYMILQFRLKTSGNVSKSYCLTLKTVAWQYFLKGTTKFRDELLEVGKDLKIKHSVSSPPYEVWGNFFSLKSFASENKLFRQTFAVCFTRGVIIRSFKGEING